MKVGFTGTQQGMTLEQINSVVSLLIHLGPVEEFHHGDCVGADAEAHVIADRLKIPIVIHPPSMKIKRAYCSNAQEVRDPLPYLERSLQIVDETDKLIAAPKDTEDNLKPETWATLRRARERKKPIYIVFPNGHLRLENI